MESLIVGAHIVIGPHDLKGFHRCFIIFHEGEQDIAPLVVLRRNIPQLQRDGVPDGQTPQLCHLVVDHAYPVLPAVVLMGQPAPVHQIYPSIWPDLLHGIHVLRRKHLQRTLFLTAYPEFFLNACQRRVAPVNFPILRDGIKQRGTLRKRDCGKLIPWFCILPLLPRLIGIGIFHRGLLNHNISVWPICIIDAPADQILLSNRQRL